MLDGIFSLEGETALISGGASGLGFGVAQAFVGAGAKVILTGRRRQALAEAASQLGERAAFVVHNVNDHAAARQLAAALEEEYGPVSILVNNAGIHLKKPALETSEDEFSSLLNTHVLGSFSLVRAFGKTMVARRHGSILFMASMTSLIGMPLVAAYSAAKSAYVGMVRSLATELGPHGLRVNAIAPGWIQTPMLEQALAGDGKRRERILARTPLARFGCPDDIGWAAVYLCSPAAKFVNGVILPVDGGASIGF